VLLLGLYQENWCSGCKAEAEEWEDGEVMRRKKVWYSQYIRSLSISPRWLHKAVGPLQQDRGPVINFSSNSAHSHHQTKIDQTDQTDRLDQIDDFDL
jgi:hypothetical protein